MLDTGTTHAVINCSGGRTSAYMTIKIVEQFHGKLPDNVHIAFCNTGRELPATYDFIERLEHYIANPIHRLEFTYNAEAAGGG